MIVRIKSSGLVMISRRQWQVLCPVGRGLNVERDVYTVYVLIHWCIDMTKRERDTITYPRKFMSDKPSLYVVEKKEVVILVVLFVLVTVLSFTMGVRYGESIGAKSEKMKASIEKERNEESHEVIGGVLGHDGAAKAVSEVKKDGIAAVPANGSAHESPAAHAEAGHGEEQHGKDNGANEKAASPVDGKGAISREIVEKESDEALLTALKDAGVESLQGTTWSQAPGRG